RRRQRRGPPTVSRRNGAGAAVLGVKGDGREYAPRPTGHLSCCARAWFAAVPQQSQKADLRRNPAGWRRAESGPLGAYYAGQPERSPNPVTLAESPPAIIQLVELVDPRRNI